MLFENQKAVAGRAGASLGSWRTAAGDNAGRFEGAGNGSDVSFFVVDAAPGDGPVEHSHPYSETFVVQAGHVRFEVEGRPIEAFGGEVVVVAPHTAHGFRALGPERLQMVAIHAAAFMETAWLDEGPKPELSVIRSQAGERQ